MLLCALDAEGLLKWDDAFLDGSFTPAKRGARPSVKPSAARARSGWYWETVKVFRWEFDWKVPLRQNIAGGLRKTFPEMARILFHGARWNRFPK
jgi:hypothetical protein